MTNQQIKNITLESLRDWFKKEKWVRITTSGNIAGPCGTSKNKKNPDRCLPRAKAQRAATARKKRKAGAKGKTVVKNTKKATVRKEDYSPLDFKYKKGFKDLTGLFKKITSSSDIETIKKLSHVFVDNLKKASKIQRARYKKDIQNGNKSSIFSLITNLYMNDNRMTSGLSKVYLSSVISSFISLTSSSSAFNSPFGICFLIFTSSFNTFSSISLCVAIYLLLYKYIFITAFVS